MAAFTLTVIHLMNEHFDQKDQIKLVNQLQTKTNLGREASCYANQQTRAAASAYKAKLFLMTVILFFCIQLSVNQFSFLMLPKCPETLTELGETQLRGGKPADVWSGCRF